MRQKPVMDLSLMFDVIVLSLQIAFAQKAKQMMWQSSQHFAFWCRYGERQQDIRRKQVDSMRYKLPLGIVH